MRCLTRFATRPGHPTTVAQYGSSELGATPLSMNLPAIRHAKRLSDVLHQLHRSGRCGQHSSQTQSPRVFCQPRDLLSSSPLHPLVDRKVCGHARSKTPGIVLSVPLHPRHGPIHHDTFRPPAPCTWGTSRGAECPFHQEATLSSSQPHYRFLEFNARRLSVIQFPLFHTRFSFAHQWCTCDSGVKCQTLPFVLWHGRCCLASGSPVVCATRAPLMEMILAESAILPLRAMQTN